MAIVSLYLFDGSVYNKSLAQFSAISEAYRCIPQLQDVGKKRFFKPGITKSSAVWATAAYKLQDSGTLPSNVDGKDSINRVSNLRKSIGCRIICSRLEQIGFDPYKTVIPSTI